VTGIKLRRDKKNAPPEGSEPAAQKKKEMINVFIIYNS